MRKLLIFLREGGRFVLPVLLLGMGMVGFASLSQRKEAPQNQRIAEPIPVVQTASVREYNRGLTIETDGVVVPYREVVLAAEVPGRITEKSEEVRAGRFVRQGSLLVRIDPRNYQLEVEKLTRELEQAAAEIEEIEAEVESAAALEALAQEQLILEQRQLRRIQTLSQRGVVTETELDEASKAELNARNNVVSLQNQLTIAKTRRNRLEQGRQLAQAKLDQAKLDLERTEIRAPFDAIVVEDPVEEGSYVQVGTPLVTLEDTSAVEVRCNLRMDELQWVWDHEQASVSQQDDPWESRAHQLPSAPATVVFRFAGREYEWQGTLSRFEGTGLDERTRTVPCRVLIRHPQGNGISPGDVRANGPRTLVRGMYVRVKVHTQPATSLVGLPERAVQPGNLVWKVNDGHLRVVPIRVARFLDDMVLVDPAESALQPGDRIITSPLTAAVDGMPVNEETVP